MKTGHNMLSFIRSLKATSSYKNTCRGFSGFSSIKPITITRISLRRIGRIRTLNENLMLFVQKTGRYEPLLKNWIFQQHVWPLGEPHWGQRIRAYAVIHPTCVRARRNDQIHSYGLGLDFFKGDVKLQLILAPFTSLTFSMIGFWAFVIFPKISGAFLPLAVMTSWILRATSVSLFRNLELLCCNDRSNVQKFRTCEAWIVTRIDEPLLELSSSYIRSSIAQNGVAKAGPDHCVCLYSSVQDISLSKILMCAHYKSAWISHLSESLNFPNYVIISYDFRRHSSSSFRIWHMPA